MVGDKTKDKDRNRHATNFVMNKQTCQPRIPLMTNLCIDENYEMLLCY